jgi:hypothetical protein
VKQIEQLESGGPKIIMSLEIINRERYKIGTAFSTVQEFLFLNSRKVGKELLYLPG